MTTPDIDKLGKYRIESVLGRGAMGVVYKGFDPVIERWVAIKTIRKDIIRDAQGQEELARFRREAQAAGRISHPNIVTVYDFGEEGDTTYIAMEYIEGKSLKDYLDNQDQFELATTVAIMKQLLSALDHSHRHGVIHRDIKPANIMMDGSLNVKVTDFGIARLESSTLTQAGTLMGTPSYMSPEQFMGVTVDNRTDIFSAGAVLYQLLTGDKPFSGSVTTIMHKVLNVEPPPPSALSVTVPSGFDAVIRKAMAKRPDDRFRTAADFAQALDLAFRGLLPVEAPAAAADATMAAPGPGGFDADATMAAGPAAADATMAAPRRQADADATMAAPRPQADADATMAAPRPQADADATMAAPRPQADADATMAAPRPQADADATMAAPRPQAATGPSAPPRQAADPSPKRGLPVVPIAAGIVVLLLLAGGAVFLLRGEEPTVQVAGGTAQPPAAQPAPSAQTPPPPSPTEATPPATATPPQPAADRPAASAPATPASPAAAEPAAPAPSTQATAPSGGSIGTGPLVPAPAAIAPAPPPAAQQAAPSPAAPPSSPAATAAAPAAPAPAASTPAPAPPAPAAAAPAAQPAPAQGTQLAARTEPATPVPAPAAPPLTWATVADDVRRTLRDVPCSTLVGRLAGEDRLVVGGAVGTADTADTVRTRLASLGPAGGLDLNARPVGASHCGLLEALEPHADQLGEAGSGLAIGLAGDRTQLQDGDNLIVTLSTPRAGGSVYVYYVTLTGDAVLIFPATADAAVRPAGEQFKFGENELFIGEPFGSEMVVAVSSSGRLFDGLPEESMPLDEFVPLLRSAFEQARGRGETVATAIEVLTTRPK